MLRKLPPSHDSIYKIPFPSSAGSLEERYLWVCFKKESVTRHQNSRSYLSNEISVASGNVSKKRIYNNTGQVGLFLVIAFLPSRLPFAMVFGFGLWLGVLYFIAFDFKIPGQVVRLALPKPTTFTGRGKGDQQHPAVMGDCITPCMGYSQPLRVQRHWWSEAGLKSFVMIRYLLGEVADPTTAWCHCIEKFGAVYNTNLEKVCNLFRKWKHLFTVPSSIIREFLIVVQVAIIKISCSSIIRTAPIRIPTRYSFGALAAAASS